MMAALCRAGQGRNVTVPSGLRMRTSIIILAGWPEHSAAKTDAVWQQQMRNVCLCRSRAVAAMDSRCPFSSNV